MSLLDIDETMKELAELDYLLYDNFVDYLSKHVPEKLWDHSMYDDRRWTSVNYIRFKPNIRVDKLENTCKDDTISIAETISAWHTCINITPTDDGLVDIEFPKYIHYSFPILVYPNEHVPKTILKLFEPIKDKLEIIEGCL